MKKFLAIILVLSGFFGLNAQSVKQASFTVHGDCDQCKKRIETAAKSVHGVKTADWENEFQMITVTYDTASATVEKIQKTIAAAGHDTEKVKAPDNVYNNLPECCHYRKKYPK